MRTRSTAKAILLFIILGICLLSCVPEAPDVSLTPPALPAETPTPTMAVTPEGYIEYRTLSGDTLEVVAAHYGVGVEKIEHDLTLDSGAILDTGTRLLVPAVAGEMTPSEILFPDAAVVFSPEAVGFDIQAFADAQGGYLSTYTELMTRGTTLASEVISQLALEHSINPRILLAVMEVESGMVSGFPEDEAQALYPFGYIKVNRAGIYRQVGWAIRHLSEGYYGWRAGTLAELTFANGSTLRLAPTLNAGTAAVLNFFAQMHTQEEWTTLVYGDEGVSQVYEALFGDPWERAEGLDPLFPNGISQPELMLPFPPNQKWNLTSGPHSAWGRYGPRAALDFAPPLDRPGCGNSRYWTTAVAPGRVVRVGNGVVVLDLDKDGYEQTGWVLVYMHVANSDRIRFGAYRQTDDIIGHPSCEGGNSSGIHVHIARKYNGEWVLAGGGIPFEMSGYVAANGEEICNYPYYGYCDGTLSDGVHTVIADPYGNYLTVIYRPESDPEYLATRTPRP